MDALDPFDMFELLDVMDWWGTGPNRSSNEYASPSEAHEQHNAHECARSFLVK